MRDTEAALRMRESELAARVDELEALRHSHSWRLTAPLRVFRRPAPAGGVAAANGADVIAAADGGEPGPDPNLELLRESPLFDPEWYRRTYPDVAEAGADPAEHYLAFGALEGRDPGPGFDSVGYLRANPDVAGAGINPLVHYLQFGQAEGRVMR